MGLGVLLPRSGTKLGNARPNVQNAGVEIHPVEADEAVSAYEALPANDSDLARVQAINALVLDLCGDPDLAVASADRAVRIWLSHRRSPTEFAIGADEANLLIWSCAVAASIHASAGRNDLSLFAAELALPILARLVASEPATSLADDVHQVTQRYSRMSDTERSTAARYYATTLRTLLWRDGRPPTGPTLAQVLTDEDPELAAELTRPATECVIATPSQRCPPSLAPALATRLVDVALRLLPGAGVRRPGSARPGRGRRRGRRERGERVGHVAGPSRRPVNADRPR
jgi:hypothetical protein